MGSREKLVKSQSSLKLLLLSVALLGWGVGGKEWKRLPYCLRLVEDLARLNKILM